MGGISTSLILTGIIWGAVGIWSGYAINLNPGDYFFCMPGGWSQIFDGMIQYSCQNLFLSNTAPALFLISGIIAKIIGY